VAAARVLLVEDEGLTRLAAAEVLQDEGFEVVEAGNDDEAVQLLSGPDAFDVLFTDVRMPGVLTAWTSPHMPGAGTPRSQCGSCPAMRRT
jgi:CheY-like chemotaxis protein